MSKKKKNTKSSTEKAPLIQNKRVRGAVFRVVVFAVMALYLLFMSGISLLTFVIGAKEVHEMFDLTKSAIQRVEGEVWGTYLDAGGSHYTLIKCENGYITVRLAEKAEPGQTVSASGFVRVLKESERAEMFAWFDENGQELISDVPEGEETDYFDYLSPMYIHDGYARFFPIAPSKVLTALALMCGIYTVLVYMGIASGKYGDTK